MQQKKLIIIIIIFFIASASYLLVIGHKFDTLDFGKDWWDVYFVSPKNNNLDFIIENHLNVSSFHWTVSDDQGKLKEGDVQIDNNGEKNIKPGLNQSLSGKITIEVSTGNNDKKDIYKNF